MASDEHKQELKERFAEEKYHKNYEDLSTKEKRSVAGFMGAEIKRELREEAEEQAHSPRTRRSHK